MVCEGYPQTYFNRTSKAKWEVADSRRNRVNESTGDGDPREKAILELHGMP